MENIDKTYPSLCFFLEAEVTMINDEDLVQALGTLRHSCTDSRSTKFILGGVI
jgi:hypothetical protein